MATMYPGKGLRLGLASSNPQEPVWLGMREQDYTIPDGESSLGVPLNAGIASTLNIEFDAAPTGTAVTIEYDVNPDFSTAYPIDTIAAVALQKIYTWSVADYVNLAGFIRVTNEGGEDITNVWVQQMSASVG